DKGAEIFQRLQNARGFPFYVIREEVCALQPNQLPAAEKWKRLQGGNGRADCSSSLFHLIRHAVNCLESKLPGLCWREFLRELGCLAFHRRLIRANNSVNVCGSCLQLRHRAAIFNTESAYAKKSCKNSQSFRVAQMARDL